MGLTSRPYIGTWNFNPGNIVQHSPDSIVYINGDTSLPGCGGCTRRIDFQEYITQVSVDASNEPGGHQASISMSIPRHTGDAWFRDGATVLRPALEIHIYQRGYFPVTGMYPGLSELAGVDASGLPIYPYYHVFHGVTTNVDTEYSSGFYTASISCASMLHFWNYAQYATNGALLGGGLPENSQVSWNVRGNNLNGMTPYSIIYEMYRLDTGAAASVGGALGGQSNYDAANAFGEEFATMAERYWRERFRSRMYGLRMYGASGQLFTSAQQVLLSRLSSNQIDNVLTRGIGSAESARSVANDPYVRAAADLGLIQLDSEGNSIRNLDILLQDTEPTGTSAGINVAGLNAFVDDIGAFGDPNLYETQYQSKLDIVSEVTRVTGFEFYQDVDGDLVFKPPFYNLDTKGNRVYRLDPVDLISITYSEAEPEATYAQVKNGGMRNLNGTGLEGEMGIRSTYVDWRLVTQYGWRPLEVDTNYYNGRGSSYRAAAAMLDVLNAKVMNTANITIPLRPELRPGYPIYLPHIDTYYYVDSLSHSFQFGGQCTTTLACSARRRKFHAPGRRNEGGINSIDLRNTVLPPKPLQTLDKEGNPRLVGFPNVVMAIDPEQVDPLTALSQPNLAELDDDNLRWVIRSALSRQLISVQVGGNSEDGPWVVPTGESTEIVFVFEELKAQATSIQQAYVEIEQSERARELGEQVTPDLSELELSEEAIAFLSLIETIQSGDPLSGVPGIESTQAILQVLAGQKAAMNVTMQGGYRYYSSSHPDPEMQGMRELTSDPGSAPKVGSLVDAPSTVPQQFRSVTGAVPRGIRSENYVELQNNAPVRSGLNLRVFGNADPQPVPTHDITTISFVDHNYSSVESATFIDGNTFSFAASTPALRSAIQRFIESNFDAGEVVPSQTGEEFLQPVIDLLNENTFFFVEGSNESELSPLQFTSTATAIQGVVVDHPFKTQTLQEIADQFSIELEEAAQKVITTQSQILASWIAQYYDLLFTPFNTQATDPIDLAEPVDLLDGEARFFGVGTRSEFNLLVQQYREDCLNLTDTFVGAVPSARIYFGNTVESRSNQTPCFPVSDAQGFEHIGSYAYGRGLEVEEGASFDQLMSLDPLRFASPQALEDFVSSIISNPDTDDLATRPETLALVQSLQEEGADPALRLLSSYYDQKDEATTRTSMLAVGLQNFIASDRNSVQAIPVTNAAFNLADIIPQDVEGVFCPCRGAEADVRLQFAEGGEPLFVGIGSDVDELNGWLQGQADSLSQTWSERQNNLRGQFPSAGQPTRSNVPSFDDNGFNITDIGEQVQQFRDNIANAAQNVEDAVDNVETAGDDLLDALQNVETEFTS